MQIQVSLGYRRTSGDLIGSVDSNASFTTNILVAGRTYELVYTKNIATASLICAMGEYIQLLPSKLGTNRVYMTCVNPLVGGTNTFVIRDGNLGTPTAVNCQLYEVQFNPSLGTQPQGFQDISLEFETDEKYRSISKKYISKLQFYRDGYTYISANYLTDNIPVLVEYRYSEIENWAQLFQGTIISQDIIFNPNECYAEVDIISTGCIQQIDANKEVTFLEYYKDNVNNTFVDTANTSEIIVPKYNTGVYPLIASATMFTLEEMLFIVSSLVTGGNYEVQQPWTTDPLLNTNIGLVWGAQVVGEPWEVSLRGLIDAIYPILGLSFSFGTDSRGREVIIWDKMSNFLNNSNSITLVPRYIESKKINKINIPRTIKVGFTAGFWSPEYGQNDLGEATTWDYLYVTGKSLDLTSTGNQDYISEIKAHESYLFSYYPYPLAGDRYKYPFRRFVLAEWDPLLTSGSTYYAKKYFDITISIYYRLNQGFLPNINVQWIIDNLSAGSYLFNSQLLDQSTGIPSTRFIYEFTIELNRTQFQALQSAGQNIVINGYPCYVLELKMDLKTSIANFRILGDLNI